MRKFFIKAIAILTFVGVPHALADDSTRIGIIAPLKGSFTVLGEDAIRGAQTALKKFKPNLNGKRIELIVAPSNGAGNTAVSAAKKLIEQSKADIIIGPSSFADGIAMRDFAKTKPEVIFINGISGAPQATLENPAENFFRFSTDNAQWSAGLGDYVFRKKEYQRISIVAEDYPFNHAQVFGFEREFCPAGGEVASRHWVKSGDADYQSIIAQLPKDIDAIYLGFNGAKALDFIRKYKAAGGLAKPIGSSITADGAFLNAPADMHETLLGMPSAAPQVETWGNADWQAFVSSYRDGFSTDVRFEFPSIFATGYYNATTAALTCIAQASNSADNAKADLQACLSSLTLNAPNGSITLDENRQANGSNFVTEIIEQTDGKLTKKLVRIRESVSQTLGLSLQDYSKHGYPNQSASFCQSENN